MQEPTRIAEQLLIQPLYHSSIELRNDKEVVLTAVQQCGWALAFASDELRSDREVILAAVQKDKLALRFVLDEPMIEVSR